MTAENRLWPRTFCNADRHVSRGSSDQLKGQRTSVVIIVGDLQPFEGFVRLAAQRINLCDLIGQFIAAARDEVVKAASAAVRSPRT